MMLSTNIFRGDLVHLTAEDPETAGKALAGWGRDSEYMRLQDFGPLRLWSAKKIQAWRENGLERSDQGVYYFGVRTIQEDRLIGFIYLVGVSWTHGDTWMGIGLGDREYWGKGYGTDAIRVILRYAFTELNLRRVTLVVFAYNPRAIKSYQKTGFKVEGQLRQHLARDGQRNDMIVMGVLREEWMQSVTNI
jgi:RimJ/RimL family protein N-acetyltransferase